MRFTMLVTVALINLGRERHADSRSDPSADEIVNRYVRTVAQRGLETM